MITMGFASDGAYSVRALVPTRDVSYLCPHGTYHEAVFQVKVCAEWKLMGDGVKPGVCTGRNTAFSTTSGIGLSCREE